MAGIAVTYLTEDKDRFVILQHRLESTQLSRTVFSHDVFPTTSTDSVLRQIQDVHSEVVLVDIDPRNPERAITAIELIHATTSEIVIFAMGEMNQPAIIVSAMRAGAREYLERNASAEAIADAFARFTNLRTRSRQSSGRARVFAVTNAKGGAGATTVAVNTAIGLQELYGGVLLVDLAPLGHTALHLNVRPAFSVVDALQNLHRLDSSLLEGLLTTCKSGLQLLAGPQQPFLVAPTAAEMARLFDQLVVHFRYVVVDCSNRMDQTARMLCDLCNTFMIVTQTDVVSLWSASRLNTFVAEGANDGRVRLIVNRYKKIPGFTDEDVEKATNCQLLWKVPNNYQMIGPAIDKGTPVGFQENHELGRCFRSLATTLGEASTNSEGGLDLSAQSSPPRKKSTGRLLISPARAGQ